MAAVGGLAVYRAERVARLADVAGAMSLEALRGTPVAFDERIHAARSHPGQIEVAAHLRELLRDSEIRQSHLQNDPRVQDAYSLRCMPQVHGAVRETLNYARNIVETETGSATDNPLVFSDTEEVLSGGNFHGAPLQPGRGVKQAYEIIRRQVPRLTSDRAMSAEIEAVVMTIQNSEFDEVGY